MGALMAEVYALRGMLGESILRQDRAEQRLTGIERRQGSEIKNVLLAALVGAFAGAIAGAATAVPITLWAVHTNIIGAGP